MVLREETPTNLLHFGVLMRKVSYAIDRHAIEIGTLPNHL
jgi:hypothetical protein